MPLKEGFSEKNNLQCCDLTVCFGSYVNKSDISDQLCSEVMGVRPVCVLGWCHRSISLHPAFRSTTKPFDSQCRSE